MSKLARFSATHDSLVIIEHPPFEYAGVIVGRGCKDRLTTDDGGRAKARARGEGWKLEACNQDDPPHKQCSNKDKVNRISQEIQPLLA